jgi:NAD(P)-dependent dehydrogenase (short-subunit alcohol dehydrogenase family)
MASVVVTGAASGIGRALVRRLAGRGVQVLAIDRDEDGLDSVLRHVGDAGHGVVADVTKEEDVLRYAGVAGETFGRVDGFFNNAGVAGARQSIVAMPFESWTKTLAINLDAAFLGIKYMVPLLRRPGGSVVTTSSVSAYRAEPARVDYTVSKLGVIGLSSTAAAEHGADGLRFNCVCPGQIDTPMMAEHERWVDASDTDRVRREISARNPMNRYGTPEEVAALVDFLLLGESHFITGAAIPVDGGFLV